MICPTCNGRGKVWYEGLVARFMAVCDDCKGSGDAPMTAPTTGADELRDTYTLTITREQLPLLNDCIYQGVEGAEQGEDLMAMDGFRIAIHQQLHNQPVATVPDAELIEAARKVVSQAHGFGATTSNYRAVRVEVMDALAAAVKAHDAWLAQQEGGDGNG